MTLNSGRIIAFSLRALRGTSLVVFIVASLVIAYGLISKPYGLEGIYYRCAHLEPPDSDMGNPVGTLFGVTLRRMSKAETLGTLFGTWVSSGLLVGAFWLKGRK